jgi:predicted TIM-barrel fold metal-dependent hydrolase
MKRIDAHCHVYPDAIAPRAVKGIEQFYDLPLAYAGTLSDLVSVQERAGISNGVIFSVATTPHQAGSINRFIADCATASEGRFVGLGTVHPESESLKEDIDTILSLGLRGVKLHPDFQKFKLDDYRCLKIFELCEGRLPVLVHTGDYRYDFSNPNRLAPVLSIFTELTVIGAHFGGWSVWDDAEAMLAEYSNFYVDTSSSLYAMSPERATALVRSFGADRVLFATDYPMWDLETEIARMEALALTPEEKAQIFYGNAERLFGFSAV